MKVLYSVYLARDLESIKDEALLRQAGEAIEATKRARHPFEVPNMKKLSVEGCYFRLRIGDYRMGLIVEGDTVTFVRLLHRKDIYRHFP